ncbi:MAG: DUF4013 domain-containing protein [Methanomicrobiales archaeon]
MEFNKIIIDSLSYPFSDPKKYIKLLILFFTSFLVIPGIMTCGYLVRIIEYTTYDKPELPEFNDWKKLLTDGLKLLGLGIIFAAFFYGILLIMDLLFNIYPVFNDISIFIIKAAYTILVNSLFIMSLAHMAHEGLFVAGFDFKKIIGLIAETGWVNYLALIFVFTVFAELLSHIIVFGAYLPIFTGIWRIFVYITLSFLIFTYLFTYESRFAGLIYPQPDLK